MKIVNSLSEMQKLSWGSFVGKKVGFVPTMGFLHEGHLSLIAAAKQSCDIVIVSIYVNPAQFGPNEDLERYPRDAIRDFDLMKPYEVDCVFFPSDAQMYPEGYKTWIEVKDVSRILCGASRPGHFTGVATIVMKLINIVKPDFVFMGEKDFQQIAVLRTMLKDLNHPAEIVSCPIIREKDGLAMSSRNAYLNEDERQRALSLFLSLQKAQALYRKGIRDSETMRREMSSIICAAGGKIDYIEFVHPDTLQSMQILDVKAWIIIAVYMGKTRLIDNAAILA